MATKTEIFNSTLELCETHGASAELVAGLTALLEPKKAGAQFNIEDVTTVDENGAITHILDSVFNVMVPVYGEDGELNFYEKPDTELGFSRFSRAAEKARKDAEKLFKATKDAVLTDLMSGEITSEEAQATMADAETARKTLVVPEGLI